jgi:hypothetical protein
MAHVYFIVRDALRRNKLIAVKAPAIFSSGIFKQYRREIKLPAANQLRLPNTPQVVTLFQT